MRVQVILECTETKLRHYIKNMLKYQSLRKQNTGKTRVPY